jgi:hypothetical protein
MPTEMELSDWCERKAREGSFPLAATINPLDRNLITRRVTKLLKEAYDYGFSQGCGTAAEAQRWESLKG